MQVWRIPAEGGQATQVTKNGGFVAFESVEGKLLVYSKLNEPGLWMLPLGEDRESQILSSLSGVDTFAVTKRGIYFMADAESGPKTASLKFIDFASRHIRHLANIKAPIDVGLTVSPDESSILYSQIDQSGADLILVENFR